MQVRVGVDVAKEWIDFAADDGSGGRVANSPTALKAWLRRWPAGTIAMESTGRHHEVLATLAQAAGWLVHVVNPTQVKRFRQYSGVRGKTDRVDAALLLQFVVEKAGQLRAWAPGTQLQRQLLSLIRQRAAWVRHLGALLQATPDGHMRRQLRQFSERGLARFDAQIEALIKRDEALHRAWRLLESIPGIGLLTAAALAVLFARIPFQTSDAAVAFVGLDLRADDSGQKTGRRFLTKKGDPEYRRLLYMAGSAATKSKLIKPLYEQLKTRRTATQAIVIVARKLLRIALAVYRTGQPFNATKLGPLAQAT